MSEIESLKKENERLKAKLEEAEEDIVELLGQEDYLGNCWACKKHHNGCMNEEGCKPIWRGSIE